MCVPQHDLLPHMRLSTLPSFLRPRNTTTPAAYSGLCLQRDSRQPHRHSSQTAWELNRGSRPPSVNTRQCHHPSPHHQSTLHFQHRNHHLTSPQMAQHPLLKFFQGAAGDYKGRKLVDILDWTDDQLESSHDYIQTLFPLPEASGVNWNAPIIDREVFETFRSAENEQLRGMLKMAFERILKFYGLESVDEGNKCEVSNIFVKIILTLGKHSRS